MKQMIAWISENVSTVLIALAVGVMIAWALVSMIKKKRKGGCGCGCSDCSGECPIVQKDKKDE